MRYVLALFLCLSALACGPEVPSEQPPAPAGVDRSTPEALAESIFRAARTGALDDLAVIAAPGADGDTRNVAGVGMAPADVQADFRKHFESGKVVGPARIDGERAEVDILFGPDGTEEETFRMVKVDGLWLLVGF